MSKKLNINEFIEKCRKVHGDKYDYSKVEYVDVRTKVCIICPIHGEFEQTASTHLKGSGCNECVVDCKTSNISTFIEKAMGVHGDKYGYSKVEYVNSKTKVCIICPKHGEFYQTPNNHLCGSGCKECGKITQVEKHTSNTSTFINKAKEVHGDKYDYSKVEYTNNHTKICIICPIHGEFWQKPNSHLIGYGCKECGILANSEKRSSDTFTFINKAKEVHGDKYDYSKVEYVNCMSKICIICPIHGEFYQKPNSHLNGNGCNECGKITIGEKHSSNTTSFILKAKEIHDDKYDYSKVDYKHCETKVCIICPIHGEFYQQPNGHLCGQGCKECGLITHFNKMSSDTPTFINKARNIHGNKYDYSKVEYINAMTKVCIICPIHGEFYQIPNGHLGGKGCKECGLLSMSEKQTSDTNTFINKAIEIHGDKYDYSKVDYIHNKNKVTIICPIHGDFYQIANSHLEGKGCPKCSHFISKPETEIGDYIESLGLEVIWSDRKILSGLELDLFIPSKNIAIEYNGLYWHSEEQGKDKNYHLNKTLMCKKLGIDLIHIFEDEYLEHKDIVLNKIKHILKVQDDSPRIMGRKCNIEVIDNNTAKSFLNTYHIQGYGVSTVHLGAVYGNELIAVMSFKKESDESLRWELTRFASNSAYVCQGIGGKLFKYFIKSYSPIEVKSFADRRWTLNEEDNLYIKLGFELDSILNPEYSYINGNKRFHKRINKRLNSSLDTDNVSNYNKIWDCGLFKYIWKKESS